MKEDNNRETLDPLEEVANTILSIMQEEDLTIGQSFKILQRVEEKIRDKAHLYKV